MAFRIGQRVVCIDDESSGRYLPPGYRRAISDSMDGLRKGAIYTIRYLDVLVGVPVCRLEEIDRGYDPFFDDEACFAQARFRPLIERKTDISIFTEMLTGTKVSEPA